MSKNNPNKVNQYTAPDPRQALFLKYYLDKNSDTFSNALQSALRAGYEQKYAEAILSSNTKWLEESVKSLNHERMLRKAEKNLDEFLDLDTTNKKIVDDEVIEYQDSQLVKVKQDTTKFVAERLGKKVWSQKTEVETKNVILLADLIQE